MSAQPLLNPTILTDEQLERIAFAIAGKVMKMINTTKPVLTSEEAAEFTQYSRRRFDELVSEGVFIPRAAKEDTDPRFIPEELIAQMPQRRRKRK